MKGKEPIRLMAEKLNKSIISIKKKFALLKAGKIDVGNTRLDLPIKRDNTKLTWDIVNQIRQDWISNIYTTKQLCEKYGRNVNNVIINRTWKDPLYKPPKKRKKRRKKKCTENLQS